MAQINKPNEYFNTVLWSGDNATNKAITGVNFQPDLVWIKNRGSAHSHQLYDVLRGATKRIFSDLTTAEETDANALTSFDSDGFSLGTNVGVNENGVNQVAWNWLANGTGVSNTDGNGNNVLVSANTTAGFSIVQGDMNASGSWTFGHGLGVAPSMIILRGQTVTSNWYVYHKSLGAGTRIFLNTTDASTSDTTFMDNTTPTANVFSMNAGTWSAGAGTKIIAYCFAEKKGFSKFDKYTGNGSTDGTFIYTGFKPAFLIIKNSSSTGAWYMQDNKRDVNNPIDLSLNASDSNADNNQGNIMDFLSNGIKIKTTGTGYNSSGATYIYMAFAENPLVGTNNIPATAR